MSESKQETAALSRAVFLREGTSDRQVWSDTFVGLYHLPPAEMSIPATVLDLGANIGLTAAHYQRLWPQAEIVAVEMDKGNAALIEQNAPGVRVRVEAVASKAGNVLYRIDQAEDAYAVYTGGGGEPPGRFVQARTLRQIILRSFADVDISNPVDFVKMDIEGMEWKLFAEGDYWPPLVRHLLVELHDPDISARKSAELIERAIAELNRLGFKAKHKPPHPRAVYAWRDK